MTNPIGARKDAIFKAISTAPSFNKTPVGSSTPPLPYPTVQDLSNSIGVVPNVRFNGKPVYVLDQSTQPSGKGDEPGVAKGVKSGTVTGPVKPVRGSTTVRAGKKAVVRHGDPCTMNGGNNPGVYCTMQTPSLGNAKPGLGKRVQTAAETESERSVLDRAMDTVRSAAKGYQQSISGSMHSFAEKAMDHGGTVAAAGGGVALVGGGMVATGIGAAPGAVIAAGGGAVAAAGETVAAVGGVTESVATGADAVAAFVVNGKLPNVANMVTAYIERMVTNKVDKLVGMVPGMKGKAKEAVEEAEEAIKRRAKKKPSPKHEQEHDKPGPAGDGAKVKGEGKDGGRCKLRPYRQGCPGGATPHHVVPDHCFKQPGTGGQYYEGAIKHADGISICVSGKSKFTKPDGKSTKQKGKLFQLFYNEVDNHGKIHGLMDPLEAALGKAGNPKGTASLGNLEKMGAQVVGFVTGCDKDDLEKQLRTYHQSHGLGPNTKLRADPFGDIKTLDPKIMGKVRTGPQGRE